MRLYHIIPLLFLLLSCACARDKAEPVIVCQIPTTVSFSKDILPIFNASCNTPGCHSGSSPTGNLDLDPSVAYTRLMKNGSGYIDTINPQFSILYSQMVSTSTPMPPTGKLDQCKINLVLTWIQQKAKNN